MALLNLPSGSSEDMQEDLSDDSVQRQVTSLPPVVKRTGHPLTMKV